MHVRDASDLTSKLHDQGALMQDHVAQEVGEDARRDSKNARGDACYRLALRCMAFYIG